MGDAERWRKHDPPGRGGVPGHHTADVAAVLEVSFYVAAEDYLYGTRVEDADLGDTSRTQNDVQIAFGFGFPIGR